MKVINWDPGFVVNGGMLEEVEQFWEMHWTLKQLEWREQLVQASVTAAWRRWREIFFGKLQLRTEN